jgi:hypothetical protein
MQIIIDWNFEGVKKAPKNVGKTPDNIEPMGGCIDQ